MMADADLPFSVTVKVRSLPAKGRMVKFEADKEVAAKIAAENGLLSVEEFVATAHAVPWRRDGVSVSGRVSAKLVQSCAISGEPLEVSIGEDFSVIFVPDTSKLAKPRLNGENEWIIDPEGDDVPDIFSGDTINLAGPWLEAFVLGLDPFARHEGAEVDFEATDDKTESPFAALAKLKQH